MRISKPCQTNKIVQIHRETVFDVSSLLLDDTFQPVTPLIDGVVNEAMLHLAPLRDDCTLELLDCISESSPAVNQMAPQTKHVYYYNITDMKARTR